MEITNIDRTVSAQIKVDLSNGGFTTIFIGISNNCIILRESGLTSLLDVSQIIGNPGIVSAAVCELVKGILMSEAHAVKNWVYSYLRTK